MSEDVERPDPRAGDELHHADAVERARRLEYITLAHVLTTAAVLYVTAGRSQAMRTAYLDDLVGVVAPIAYLIGDTIRRREANERFPYGYHGALGIAFFWAAISIIALGIYIVYESVAKLVIAEHATMGSIDLFGQTLWLGWLAIAALLVYNAAPRYVIGRIKVGLAQRLHDKILRAEAEVNRADWLAAVAAAVGVVGIAFGVWWVDPAVAGLIGLEIVWSGYEQFRKVANHLMSETPTEIASDEPVGLEGEIADALARLEWVRAAQVRLREEGRVVFGEAFVVPLAGSATVEQIRAANVRAYEVSPRLEDIVVTIVPSLEHRPLLKGLQEVPSRRSGAA